MSSTALSNLVATPAIASTGVSPDRWHHPGQPPPPPVVTTPSGLSPAQVAAAYSFPTTGGGAGQTIAIVDAYNDPNIASDLATFDAQYGLSAPGSFLQVNQYGQANALPAPDVGWSMEIALDVEWAHAMAPQANILLVEASSNSISDLMTAVNYAATKASVVSMSWGGVEMANEATYDSSFNKTGVTFVASAGDVGGVTQWPAASPNVLSVGGTTLTTTSTGGSTQSAWSAGGGGLSAYEAQPSYQKGIVTQSATARATPDVAYVANPSTGVSVYDSYGYYGSGAVGWLQVGGTSAGAPQVAALVANANAARVAAGMAPLTGATQTLPMLYGLAANSTTYAADFHDVTTGSAGANRAGTGYDLATGLGSLVAGKVITALSTPPATPHATSTVVGPTATITATVTASAPSHSAAAVVVTDTRVVVPVQDHRSSVVLFFVIAPANLTAFAPTSTAPVVHVDLSPATQTVSLARPNQPLTQFRDLGLPTSVSRGNTLLDDLLDLDPAAKPVEPPVAPEAKPAPDAPVLTRSSWQLRTWDAALEQVASEPRNRAVPLLLPDVPAAPLPVEDPEPTIVQSAAAATAALALWGAWMRRPERRDRRTGLRISSRF